jgi:hypothetical protein
LIIVGNLIGFAFAAFVFTISVVSFPLLLDRDVGLAVAVWTSVRAVAKNPLTMTVWAMIIAVVLFVAPLPLLVGLAIAMPVLGHATWHLYRPSWSQTSRVRARFRMRQRRRTMAFEAPPEQPESELNPNVGGAGNGCVEERCLHTAEK